MADYPCYYRKVLPMLWLHTLYLFKTAGFEKAVQSVPVKMVEEARQETVRIIKSSSRPRDNLMRAEREALRTLKKNTELTILPADKGNATVILNIVECKQITSFLEDLSYRKPARDPTDSTERKITLLLKKFTLTEDICKQLHPAGSRPPRLYGLPKIHKDGVPLRPTVSNIGTPTYQLSQVLSRTSQPTHWEFGTPCEKLLPVCPDIGISTSIIRRSNG